MRLIFAGTPEPAVVALQRLLDSEHEIVAVLTRPDARRGRGRSLYPSPVKELALSQGIEVLTPSSLKPDTGEGEALRARLCELAPEAIPVVAYGQLITADLLDIAPHGWINLHFSLLPAWRGAAPVQAAIAAGERATGATCFRIDAGLDTGPILSRLEEPIYSTDTADDLLSRLAYAGADLLSDTMTGLAEGRIIPQIQPVEGTYAPKLSPADAQVNWEASASLIDQRIRAYTPAPGAWTTFHGERLKLGPVTPTANTELAPGELQISRAGVLVGAGAGAVSLGRIQPPGKKMMAAADWARGLHVTEGLHFV